MITDRLDKDGNPYGVYCSNPACGHYVRKEGAHPIWSDDCPIKDGALVCDVCGAPVVLLDVSEVL